MKRAVIIGAGPAGLTAARELVARGGGNWRVTILEETSAVGGISRTVAHNGCRIDLGGHRFFSKSPEVNAIWRETLPGKDAEREDLVLMTRPRKSRIRYRRTFFDYPVRASLSTFAKMGFRDTVVAGLSYLWSVAFKRDENSLEDFYVNRFGRKLYSMFFENYTEKLWGVHPSRISPEWGAQRVKGLSIAKALLNAVFPKREGKETSLIESFLYPKRGPGQLWEAMADALRGAGVEIRFGAKVTGVLRGGRGEVGAVRLEDGETVPCDALFSSMPVKDLVAAFAREADGAAWGPDETVRAVAAALPYRDFVTVGLKVPKDAVPQMADTWIYVQEREVRMGRIQLFNNWSPYMVDDSEAHWWIGLEYFCAEGDDLWRADEETFVREAIGELRAIGILNERAKVLDAVRIRVKKAYPAYFGSYRDFGKVRAWLDAVPNLYCIGRNGQHRYNNMDHSMLCGLEAVRELLASERDRTALWAVNAEKSYHEETGGGTAGEFVRYVLACGFAFAVDFGTLILFRERVFPRTAAGVYAAVLLGFAAGHVTNYLFSLWFVFRRPDERRRGWTWSAFALFTAVGATGAGLTELGMWIGYGMWHFNYVAVKLVMAGVVVVWNFIGRKLVLSAK